MSDVGVSYGQAKVITDIFLHGDVIYHHEPQWHQARKQS
jgi:hypothetical protein